MSVTCVCVYLRLAKGCGLDPTPKNTLGMGEKVTESSEWRENSLSLFILNYTLLGEKSTTCSWMQQLISVAVVVDDCWWFLLMVQIFWGREMRDAKWVKVELIVR